MTNELLMERDALRQRLAERDALLAEAMKVCEAIADQTGLFHEADDCQCLQCQARRVLAMRDGAKPPIDPPAESGQD